MFAVVLNEALSPHCSPKRSPGAPHECSRLSEPACSHRTLLLSPSWLTPALGAVCPGAHLSMPPRHFPFRWEITLSLVSPSLKEKASSKGPSGALWLPAYFWCFLRPHLFTGRLKLFPMEILMTTLDQSFPLALLQKQRNEMGLGLTQWALVFSISKWLLLLSLKKINKSIGCGCLWVFEY